MAQTAAASRSSPSGIKYPKVLVCIDKFKDTLSANEAAKTIQTVLHTKFPSQVQVSEVPISDGGEGFLESVSLAHQNSEQSLQKIPFEVVGPFASEAPRETSFLLDHSTQTAFLEVAAICGLQFVPVERRDPYLTSSAGVGQAMRKCYDEYNVRRFVIGSGGSAFSDGGLGAVQALNVFDFFDGGNQLLSEPFSIANAQQIRSARVRDFDFLSQVSVLMPCDVTSPLLGPKGAAHVFGPQKGATAQQIPMIDQNIEHVIRLFLRAQHGHDQDFDTLAQTPSSGASGGIVGAFLSLFGMERTSLVSGLDFVADLTDLQQKVSGSDLVVTGEGSFDLQTLQGKAVAQIIDICLQKDKHVVVLCGVNQVTQQDLSGKYSDDQLKKIKVYDLVSRYGAEGSMKRTKECLELLCSTEIQALFTSSGDGDGASQSE